MSHQSGHIITTDSMPTIESVLFSPDKTKQLSISLLIETSLVMIVAVLAIRLWIASSVAVPSWFVTPSILLIAALIPMAVRKAQFPGIGLDAERAKLTLLVVCRTCAIVFPALFLALWLLNACGLRPPLQPLPPQNQQWLRWVFYQFMYVSVAEEVFFRGYVLTNIQRLAARRAPCGGTMKCGPRLQNWISIVISAACFAVAHIIVQGQIISALIFLPGLILGWLFIRTRTLLAPILFHGLANTLYCIMAAIYA